MKIKRLFIQLVLIYSFLSLSVVAQTSLINYQGKLSNSNGSNFSGSKSITFSMYEGAESATAIWSEQHSSVSIQNGIFNVLLGSVAPMPDSIFTTAGQRYLGVKVENEIEFKPRFLINAVPSSVVSKRTSTHRGVAFSAYVHDNFDKSYKGPQDPLKCRAVTNNIGGYYDSFHGEFIAPAGGIYLFTMIGLSQELGPEGLNWTLWFRNAEGIKKPLNSAGSENGEPHERATLSFTGLNNSVSRTIITRLERNDIVYIVQTGSGSCDNYRSGWEGALLYAEP